MADIEGESESHPIFQPSCSVCLRQIAVTNAGLVRQHGPVTSWCPGSRRPPAFLSSTGSQQHPQQQLLEAPRQEELASPPSEPSLPPRVSGKIIKNDHTSWVRLLRFSERCLRHPGRGGCRRSLATAVNRKLRDEADPPPSLRPSAMRNLPRTNDSATILAARVSAKLEEGDFRGAVRLASSDDTLVPINEATFEALKAKHPPSHPQTALPPVNDNLQISIVTVEEIIQAIHSFPKSSAGGPDGLRPQHLKDMMSVDISCLDLLPNLTSFVQLVLEGRTPQSIQPFFFGANLTAIQKKGGGIRPIAVGCTLRRLSAKVAGGRVLKEMGNLLAPQQLGFGVRGGGEAAVHAVRLFLHDLDPSKSVLKLDFKNAFNSIYRDKMLEAVIQHVPQIYPFVHSAYSSVSSLFWWDKTIQSAEGVQQGDLLGPLLFCLSIHHIVSHLESELSLFYLDDGTLGGETDKLLRDLEMVEREGVKIRLQLNSQKSEIICANPESANFFQSSLPGALVVNTAKATLLGSPIGDVYSISESLTAKVEMLQRMGERLQCLSSHDAILLKHSFALPKLLYSLRTAPCFLSPVQKDYDDVLRSTLSAITNIHFGVDDPSWTQATLPVKMGGLGIRSAVQLAPSAFLASAAATSDLVHLIVPPYLQSLSIPNVDEAKDLWSLGHGQSPPEVTSQHQQRAWDIPKMSALAESLLENAPDPRARARLLASATKESGAWLNALPISSLGLRMDNDTIRVAAGLRLGAPLCMPHSCHHCGEEVDCLAMHGLSYRWSEGRHHRHAAVNDIIHRTLAAAKVPSRLEPSGLYRTDGKHPDGITVVPWKSGKLLVWDATCPDTFAPSYSSIATREAAAVEPWPKRERQSSMSASVALTHLPQWLLRLQESLGLGLQPS